VRLKVTTEVVSEIAEVVRERSPKWIDTPRFACQAAFIAK